MTTEKNWGGSRANSGRKTKYGEKTVLVRVPASWHDELARCLSENINPFDCVQNQGAEKDKLISELSTKFDSVQNQLGASDNEVARLSIELSAIQRSLETVQNQVAEKDKLISELSTKFDSVQNQLGASDNEVVRLSSELSAIQRSLETAQNQLDNAHNQLDNAHNQNSPIESVRGRANEPNEPARQIIDGEIKKAILQQANQLHAENSELSKSHIAKMLSEKFDVRMETARDWLKKLW